MRHICKKLSTKIIIGTWPLSGDYGKIDYKQVQDILEYCYETSSKYGIIKTYRNHSINIDKTCQKQLQSWTSIENHKSYESN